jgi:hypothetical protein
VGEELNFSHMTIWRVLHEHLLYPCHLQPVQHLMPADFPMQENFYRCFLQQSAEHFFVSKVFFTDEAHFGTDAIINIHNQHQWTEENPHVVIHSRHQQQFSINVWACIVGDCLIGPHVLPCRLTGNHYRDFLLHNLPKLLEAVPLEFKA